LKISSTQFLTPGII